MTARSSRPDPPTPRPLSNWSIAAGALVVLGVAAVVWFVLLRRYGGQGAQVQLDAIRTAGTLVIGTGGAVALLLAARRQRYTELTLVHTTRDATERRITELYTKAADQLGSDQAPVRLAGLHALERLAQNTPEQRQTIVDVICAYLRMPYKPLGDQPPAEDARAEAHTRYENRRQEQQVRLTAENILSRNLRVVAQRRRRWWHGTPLPAPAWPGIHLDLTGALLLEFFLLDCQLGAASFRDAQFGGMANFEGARFASWADFRGAQFASGAHFLRAQFTGDAYFGDVYLGGARFASWADFRGAKFTRGAHFTGAQFADGAAFGGARFASWAAFGGAEFTRATQFTGAHFAGETDFRNTQFTSGADFRNTQFTSETDFRNTQFASWADFAGARITSAAEPESLWPPGWTTRPAKPDNGENPAFRYLTKVEEGPPPDA